MGCGNFPRYSRQAGFGRNPCLHVFEYAIACGLPIAAPEFVSSGDVDELATSTTESWHGLLESLIRNGNVL